MQDNSSIEIFFSDVKNPLIIDIDDYINIYQKRKWFFNKNLERVVSSKTYGTIYLSIEIMNPQTEK